MFHHMILQQLILTVQEGALYALSLHTPCPMEYTCVDPKTAPVHVKQVTTFHAAANQL